MMYNEIYMLYMVALIFNINVCAVCRAVRRLTKSFIFIIATFHLTVMDRKLLQFTNR